MDLDLSAGETAVLPGPSGSPFVHFDTGSVRAWPRMSYSELAKIFPDGKTLHIASNGKTLKNYAAAQQAEKSGQLASLGGGGGGGGSGFPLFGFGGNAALQVAAGLRRDNIPVALVVTVDPTRGGPLSTNVGRYVNFFFSGNGLGSRLKSAPGVPQSRISNIDMGERDEVAGAGDDHWTVTHNAAIQSEILKLVKRAAR